MQRAQKLLWFLGLAALVIIAYNNFVLRPTQIVLVDFSVYLEAAQRLLEGKSLYHHEYVVSVKAGHSATLYYFYPPLLAALLAPLTTIDFQSAQWVWTFVSFACLLFAACGLARIAEMLAFREREQLPILTVILLGLACFQPIAWGSMEGQVHTIILLLTVVWARCYARGESWLAGALIAVAAWIKLSPVLLLLVAIKSRDWRMVFGFIAMSLVFALLLLRDPLIFPQFANFFHTFGRLSAGVLEPHNQFNFAIGRALLLPFGAELVVPLKWAIRFVMLALLAVLVWRSDVSDERGRLQLAALLVAAMVFISPVIWFHHLTWIALPIVVRAADVEELAREQRMRVWALCLVAYIALSHAMEIHQAALDFGAPWAYLSALFPGIALISLVLRRSEKE